MKRYGYIDIALVALTAFCAVALVGAATIVTSGGGGRVATPTVAASASGATNPDLSVAKAPLTWDQAQAALSPAVPAKVQARTVVRPDGTFGTGSSPAPAAAPRSHEATLSKCAPASDRQRQVLLQDPSNKDGWNSTYEPATPDGCRGPALRSNDPANNKPNPAGHNHGAGDCHPTPTQKAYADKLLADTTKSLRDRYLNQPQNAIADGFYAYPVPDTKWFHMFSSSREGDAYELDPLHIESFMYAMTDEGLTPIGAMYIFAPKDQPPPNPTGCLMQWHNHTGAEGAATSFDPNNATTSVWMAHIWIYGGVDPWGRDFDGSEAEQWFMGYRYIPALCNNSAGNYKGDCI